MTALLDLWHLRAGVWARVGSAPEVIVPPPVPTFPPVLGTYTPGPDTTGPRPGTVFITKTGTQIITAPGVYNGFDYYGKVQVNVAGVTFRNCIFRGANPGLYTADTSAAIMGNGADSLHGAIFEDCRIDLRGRHSWRTDGINGGNFTMRRCELVGGVDAVKFTKQGLPGHATLFEACWIHGGEFMSWPAGTPNSPQTDNKTHNDGFQFQYGKNITIRYCVVGGFRDYTLPRFQDAFVNLGDDYENAGFMIQQAGTDSDLDRVENVLLEHCLVIGGAAGINLAYSSSTPSQTWNSLTIRNMRFVRRPQPVGSTHGYYFIKNASPPITATISDNVFDDDGTPVTITGGA